MSDQACLFRSDFEQKNRISFIYTSGFFLIFGADALLEAAIVESLLLISTCEKEPKVFDSVYSSCSGCMYFSIIGKFVTAPKIFAATSHEIPIPPWINGDLSYSRPSINKKIAIKISIWRCPTGVLLPI